MARSNSGSSIAFVASVLAAGVLSATALAQGIPLPRGETAAPNATSKAVLREIRHYKTWPKFPENPRPKRSKSHSGLYVVTFHNAKVTQAMKQHTLPLPDGSIIVKENRPKPSAKPTVLTVMAKRNGHWYWLETTPAGKVVKVSGAALEGEQVQNCQACHGRQTKNDDVFTHDFSK